MRSLYDRQHEEQQSKVPTTLQSGTVGRLRFDIYLSNSLVESGFTGPQIASILCFSPRTVRRRLADHGLSMSNMYASISDTELKSLNHCQYSVPAPVADQR